MVDAMNQGDADRSKHMFDILMRYMKEPDGGGKFELNFGNPKKNCSKNHRHSRECGMCGVCVCVCVCVCVRVYVCVYTGEELKEEGEKERQRKRGTV